jgi:glutamyl-tRNA reductase
LSRIAGVVFVLLGANYNDIPLEQLEALERHTDQIRDALLGAANPQRDQGALAGGVLIGTCNRFEVYLDTNDFHRAVDETVRVVSAISGLDADYVSKVLRVSNGSAVAQHLYSVAAGLDSMIVGEAEISGQVKRSLKDAQDGGHATSSLNSLFQTAATVAKRVATETGLGVAGRSLIASGLELFEQRFGSLAGKRAVLFGTGAYARVSVAALQRAGVAEIQVYSESGRAAEFSANRETTPVERGQLRAALASADVVVTASGSRNYSISYHLAKDVLERQAELAAEGGPAGLDGQEAGSGGLRIVDVSLAPSVAPHAYELEGVNILDLEYIRQHAPAEHAEAVLAARDIVAQAVAEFEAEQAARTIDPMIAALRAQVAEWIGQEVDRVRGRAGDATAQEVERSLTRVTNALLHSPTVSAKELAKAGNHEDYAAAIKTLFGIDLNGLVNQDD